MMSTGSLTVLSNPKDVRICEAYGVLQSSNGFVASHASTGSFNKREPASPEAADSNEDTDRGRTVRFACDATGKNGSSGGGCILPPIDDQSHIASQKAMDPACHNQVAARPAARPHRAHRDIVEQVPPALPWARDNQVRRRTKRSSTNEDQQTADAAAELGRRRSVFMRRQRLIDDESYMDREIGNLRRGKFQTQSIMRQTTKDELYENACLYTPYATAIRQRKESRKNADQMDPFGVTWSPSPEKANFALNRSRSTPSMDTRHSSKASSAGHKRGVDTTSSTYEARSLRQQIEESHRKLQELEGREEPVPEESDPEDVHSLMRSMFKSKSLSYADLGVSH